MTKKTPIATAIADLRKVLERIRAMPDTGAVLYNTRSGMALSFTDDCPSKAQVGGLPFARIFTDAERGLGTGNSIAPHFRRIYQDGTNHPFACYDIKIAKRFQIERLEQAIATLESHNAA